MIIKKALVGPGDIPTGEEDPSYYVRKLKLADRIVTEVFPDMPRYQLPWAYIIGQVLYKNSINTRFKIIREDGTPLIGTEDWPVLETDKIAALRARLNIGDDSESWRNDKEPL